MPRQHDASAFHEVFVALPALPIVGGQAVNLWAEHYQPRARELDEFAPFLSKDADLFGELRDLGPVPSGWRLTFYGQPRQSAVALLSKDLPDGEQLRVEVMRAVHGLTTEDLARATLVEARPGRSYRLPSPIILLKAKIANTHDLAKKERPQDLKHVRMLVPICAHYLRDLHASVLAGATPERTLINTLHALLAVTSTRAAKTVAAANRVDFSAALPLDLRVTRLPKLAAFYAHLSPKATSKRPPRRSGSSA